jgi:general secretion pathway protein I
MKSGKPSLDRARPLRSGARRRGFTLLEVMVAVAILGLGLTAIMSAQAGAFAASKHARNVSVATALARCKMNEAEEKIMRLGLPVADEAEAGMCCEGDNNTLFRCAWRVDLPKLPEAKLGALDLASGLGDGGVGGTFGALASLDKGGSLMPGGDGGIGAIAQSLVGGGAPGGAGDPAAGGGAAGGVGGIASMVMGIIYPQLKGVMEASTRRVSVTVSWVEGKKEHSFEVMQWVTNPQQSGLIADAIDMPGGMPGMPGSGAAGTTGGASRGGTGPALKVGP